MATNYVIGENKSLREFKTINEVTATTEVKDKTKIYSVENDLYYLKNGEPSKIGSGGAGGGLVKTTYAELVSARDKGELAEGSWYRITDYTCKVDSSQTWIKSAEHQFDIIVMATSTNTIDENAFATLHEGDTYFQYANLDGWTIKYSLDNSKCNYIDTTNGKGCIYYMMDEYGNECDYDFKNIKVLRYEITATTLDDKMISNSRAFTSQTSRTGWTIDTSNKYYFYTFSWCPNSTLEDADVYDLSVMDLSSNSKIVFKNNKFFSYIETNAQFQPSCFIITKLASESTITLAQFTTFAMFDNKLETTCYGNTFNGKYSTSIISTGNNYIGGWSYSNSFGAGCCSNSFGTNCYSNSFGASCCYNSFEAGCCYNSFGARCIYWTVTSSNACFVGPYIQGTGSSKRTISGQTRKQYWS